MCSVVHALDGYVVLNTHAIPPIDEKLVDMISAQEELQKAREADVARGIVEAEALHGRLAEHKTLGEKHEELSPVAS